VFTIVTRGGEIVAMASATTVGDTPSGAVDHASCTITQPIQKQQGILLLIPSEERWSANSLIS